MDQDVQFEQRKRSGIKAISVCELDKSPKGSVDEPIRALVDLINAHRDYCTTSSCSGRISLFHTNGEQGNTVKGRGFWLLALHRALETRDELERALVAGLEANAQVSAASSITLLKHEPFVLHVLCRSVQHAQAMLQLARESGFRESGISVSNDHKIILAVRTSSNVLEVPVAFNGKLLCTSEYLAFLSDQANAKFQENVKRVDHFHASLQVLLGQQQQQQQGEAVLPETKLGTEWRAMGGGKFKRWAHVCVVLDSARVLLFGGWKENARTNETLIWNALDSTFHAVQTGAAAPPALVYHTGTRVNEAGEVLVFGGRTAPQSPSNDLWRFLPATSSWDLVDAGEVRPQARYRHAACSDGISGRLFVYGGRAADGSALGDLWMFDGRWTKVETFGEDGAPGCLFAHAMVASPTKLYLHGGLSSDSTKTSDAIYVLDLATKTWSKAATNGGLIPWRFSHNWVVNFANPQETYMCGGVLEQCSAKVLGLEEALEIKLVPEGGVEVKRLEFTPAADCELLAVQHSFAVLNQDTIVVFGGGATCFAFGSVYSPSAQLVAAESGSTAAASAAGEAAYLKCAKAQAVQVKKRLVELDLLDKSRKVEHSPDGALCFPVLPKTTADAVSEPGCELIWLAPKQRTPHPQQQRGDEAAKQLDQVLASIFGPAATASSVRIERVDDVLLVPAPSTSTGEVPSQLWDALLALHAGANRIVRRERVDSGVMRQSRNTLIYSKLPREQTCWVTKTENGVIFSWDMCQVMYSKGNVSEKLRFANLVQPGETVLDLFAGIGYFTLPALKLARPDKVYSCELNPHSVRALRRNLVLNGIDPARSQIFPGDCRHFNKENFAHRISLGLLPDARVGFKPACMAIVSGGWMHIHENVNEDQIQAWGEAMAMEIANILNEHRAGGDDDGVWTVTCKHIQRVKSYAPRIFHVVGDLHCERAMAEVVKPAPAAPTPTPTLAAKQRSSAMQSLALELRNVADALLCNTQTDEREVRTLAADGEILFKRVGAVLRQRAERREF